MPITEKAIGQHAAEVCDLYGISILSDLEETDASTEEHPIYRVIFALGQYQELAAGLRRSEITPWFRSEAALEFFCMRHIERFRQLADSDEPLDATGWEV